MWPNAKLGLRQEYTVTHQGNPKTRHQKRFKWIKRSEANKPPLTLQFTDWFLLTDTLSTLPLTCTLFTPPLTCTLFSHRHTLHTLTHRQALQSQAHSSHLNSQADSPHLHSQEHSTHRQTLHTLTHRQTLHTFTHRNTPLTGKLSTSLISTLTTHPLTNSDTLSLSLLTHRHSPQHFYSKLYLSNTFTNGDSLHVSPSRHISTFTNTQPRIVSHCQIRCKVC